MSSLLPLCATISPLRQLHGEFEAAWVLRETHRSLRKILRSAHWRSAIALLRAIATNNSQTHYCPSQAQDDKIHLTTAAANDAIARIVQALIPWRIGPFTINDFTIDSEWVSRLKWRRIHPLLQPTAGKRIADIGCSNGYFLFQLLRHSPELALGFDPVERCWLQFAFLRSLANHPALGFVPVGISGLKAFPNFFDLILCMGVTYHQRDPFSAVRALFESTRLGGQVILESLVIDREGSYLLIPRARYAKMRNAWIIPTAEALASLMERAGFKEITIHRFGAIRPDEQRTTAHAPYESLMDFLDPNDPSLTIEGYPAPHSAAVVGYRR